MLFQVAKIIGIAETLKSDELVKLGIDDVQDLRSTILVFVSNTKNYVKRAFTILFIENCSNNLAAICKKYMDLRKKKTKHKRFFVSYTSNKCPTQLVGKNFFERLPK